MRTFAVVALAILAVATARPEPPVSQYLPPNQQYGVPQANTGFQRGHGGSGGFDQSQYLPPNQQYGAPGLSGNAGGGYDNAYYDTPARYEFEYTVNDIQSGNDFGHKESRDGDLARGTYYVLLPDGRRQTVEYEADNNGYRPRITYTQEGYGAGGGNNNNNNNGYRY